MVFVLYQTAWICENVWVCSDRISDRYGTGFHKNPEDTNGSGSEKCRIKVP